MRALAILCLLAACGAPHNTPDASLDAGPSGPPWFNEAGVPYCWNYDCPGDPGASTCGMCKDPQHDRECPPGFVCSCADTCVKGPRGPDGGPPCVPPDAGVPTPDAMIYDWPTCDESHPPGT